MHHLTLLFWSFFSISISGLFAVAMLAIQELYSRFWHSKVRLCTCVGGNAPSLSVQMRLTSRAGMQSVTPVTSLLQSRAQYHVTRSLHAGMSRHSFEAPEIFQCSTPLLSAPLSKTGAPQHAILLGCASYGYLRIEYVVTDYS